MAAERRTGLCISRNPGQAIIIRTENGPVILTISKVRGDRVTIHFESSALTNICREEIYDPENVYVPKSGAV